MADDYVQMSGNITTYDMSGDVRVGSTTTEISGGSTVEVNPIVTSGKKIADIYVDGEASSLYTPSSTYVTPTDVSFSTNSVTIAHVSSDSETKSIVAPTTTYSNSFGTTGATQIGTIKCGSSSYSVWAPEPSSTVTYSTAEQAVGRWVDGRIVYRKTFLITDNASVGNGIWYLVPSSNKLQWSQTKPTSALCFPGYNPSTWIILRVEGGFCNSAINYWFNFPTNQGSFLNNVYVTDNGNFEVYTSGVGAYKDGYITAEYVKAT